MKDTIKAVKGYNLFALKDPDNGERVKGKRLLRDGEQGIMIASIMKLTDMEAEREVNECWNFCEKFTTESGNEFIYWNDTETGEDFLTKVPIGYVFPKLIED